MLHLALLQPEELGVLWIEVENKKDLQESDGQR